MTRRRLFLTLILAAAAAMMPARAQQQDAGDRFRYERGIVTTGTGPQRLAIDVPLLAGGMPFRVAAGPTAPAARDGLADLRLFDADGKRVPHLILYAPRAEPEWLTGRVLPILRTEKASGFELDLGAAPPIDAISVSGLPAPFLKRLTLEGSGDREHWTVLAREATLFDLPQESLRQTDLAFAPGEFRYLRVTWNDTNSGRVPLPSSVRARRVAAAPPPRPLTAPLGFERRPSEPGRSRYRIRLPGAHLPIVALVIEAGGGHVFRPAAVSEARLSGGEASPAELGRATLTRVVRDGINAGTLRIPIAPPAEAEIDLSIDDGSNPPLDVTAVVAEFAELPWIYFEAPARPVMARYGNASAVPPAYDLEAVRDSLRIGDLPEARWADPRPLAETETPAPALPETGAPLDAGAFSYSRAIPDGVAGLIALPLDAAVLAHSRGPAARFADVRIVDRGGRQVPYLLERRDEPLVMKLTTETATATAPSRAAAPPNVSRYLIRLPYSNLPAATIAIETPARVFQRRVQLGVERPPDRRRRDPWIEVLASATWSHGDEESAAPALLLPVGAAAGDRLLLTIDEGDNSALPLGTVQLLLPSYRLRWYRPAGGSLRLTYGRDDLSPPRYDLALLAPRVMGAEALEISAGPESAASSLPGASFVSPRVFWLLLGVAVVILLGLIVRLVRNAG